MAHHNNNHRPPPPPPPPPSPLQHHNFHYSNQFQPNFHHNNNNNRPYMQNPPFYFGNPNFPLFQNPNPNPNPNPNQVIYHHRVAQQQKLNLPPKQAEIQDKASTVVNLPQKQPESTKVASEVKDKASTVVIVSSNVPQKRPESKKVASEVKDKAIYDCYGGRARIKEVVERVISDMVGAGEAVYVWNVSRLVLRKLAVDSWVSLGFWLHEVPSMHSLILEEEKKAKGSIGTFIAIWKEACTIYTGVELFEKILDFYLKKKRRRIELINCFSTSTLQQLLNVAVISIQIGTWDKLSNTFRIPFEQAKNVDDSTRTFVRNWKEACQKLPAAQAFEKMLKFCGFETKIRNRLKYIFSTFPLLGFLDVAVTSIKCGAWDSLCDSIQPKGEIVHIIKKADVEPKGLSCHADVYIPLGGPQAKTYEKVVSRQYAEHDFNEQKASSVIESIRREEFGMDTTIPDFESKILKKQHARMERALHCLSQELYSQDSRFLLELVQNADDNLYSENVEPSLTFILQPTGIVVLNNERGFTAENMRALCDVGNSTKKGSSAGHIGHKGVGFKSVFRVTDAPEIHSNGFHVKFDISEGQLGYVLPTILSSCDSEMFKLPTVECDVQKDTSTWNTHIRLPLKRKLLEGSSLSTISSMFSDLHPSLLLFLRRLQCINLRNMLDDSHIVMKKEIVGDGIVRVSHGEEKMTYFVTSAKLHPDISNSNVQTTEISIALVLKEIENGVYEPFLKHQPVFAFLPLRTYGLNFILQADFVLTLSREDVDGDSAWNQWRLSEFPDLFVNAEKSICSLPCFQENYARAVNLYMSFVPLIGEVQGFFSELPQMIISKLSQANCLLLDGFNDKWVQPCKVLEGWNEQAKTLLPGNLLWEHLGLGFLHKDIDLRATLATSLGIQNYGPTTLIQFIISLSHTKDGVQSMGLSWLFSWLVELHNMVLFYAPNSTKLRLELDLLICLKKVPFIPLSNGTYSSLDEGNIWVHDYGNILGHGEFDSKAFPNLHATLRTVNPALFSESSNLDLKLNCMRMLQKFGVHLMSGHELIKHHILPSLSNDSCADKDHQLMVEHITFVMLHFQSSCIDCHDKNETDHIISEIRSKAVILTNHGYKRLDEVPIHFSREFGNSVTASRFLRGLDYNWHEIDTLYLKNQNKAYVSSGLTQWREFFQKLGVTDFVKVVQSEKSIAGLSSTVLNQMMRDKNIISSGLFVEDWESPELVDILNLLSKRSSQKRCKYFLEVLDALWDDYFSDKTIGVCSSTTADKKKIYYKSSLVACLSDVKWVVSSVDGELHFPRELYCDCDDVRSILGHHAPCAVPKIGSKNLLTEIGFKTQVTLDDALAILQTWRSMKSPLTASLSQMCKFYSFICEEMATSRQQVVDAFRSAPFIFVPSAAVKHQEDVVAGVFLYPEDVYWDDSTGSMDHIKDVDISVPQNSLFCKTENKKASVNGSSIHLSKRLCSLYPMLYNFFVTEFSVNKAPSFHQYLQILKHLSEIPLSQVIAKAVFHILLYLSFCLKCGTLSEDEVIELKSCISQFCVLPAMQDKWVSAESSFGIVCWCDDDNLKKEFDHRENIVFLYFGELTANEKEILQTDVSVLLRKLCIHSLSKIVFREPMCEGRIDIDVAPSTIKRVLPVAQRYLYNLHPESYNQLKLSEFSTLRELRVVTVEKLCYRNVILINKNYCTSKKQYERSSLLQNNVLYRTKDSDPHAVFMEFSRLLFDGTPNLHLANFLYMINLMAGSGSTVEQIESFILNNQNMVKLPKEEPVWSLPVPLALPKNNVVPRDNPPITSINVQISSKSKVKLVLSSSSGVVWKPKTGIKTQTVIRNQNVLLGTTSDVSSSIVQEKVDALPPNADDVQEPDPILSTIIGKVDDSSDVPDSNLLNLIGQRTTESTENETGAASSVMISQCNDVQDPIPTTSCLLENQTCQEDELTCLSTATSDDLSEIALESEEDLLDISEKTQILQTTNTSMLTGRQGEEMAFRYYTEKVGGKVVNWVNQEKETGLPYDILLGEGEEESREYIEVKASRNAKKNWFQMSRPEWEFAVEKGDTYSVAHVILSDHDRGSVTVYKNPVKLCQMGELRLLFVSSKYYFIRRKIDIPS